ncbi:MarR family winged helix-turn-helix transcriptional regulator [Roseibium salinum]|uniref:MarR family transcriptional regulator n=1 Tax=Roseibium salinum TaxID=1604349 RepID=A0ABT3R2S5_9HYPH|nr:MarR family transcriptional regulator [Roseibium sp. DSM 29163]MCX2723479.1 MarR family transcriptional regulator [Roseibium sp. DSM 29163]
MKFDRETSAGYLVNHMARLFARQLERRIKPHGIALGAFPALLYLWEKDGLTQKELVDRLDIEQPTMAATLSRMERDGLITRRRGEGDARVQYVHLTDRARQLRDIALGEAVAVNELALADLDETERQQFLDLTSKVLATLSALEEE